MGKQPLQSYSLFEWPVPTILGVLQFGHICLGFGEKVLESVTESSVAFTIVILCVESTPLINLVTKETIFLKTFSK